MSASKIALRSGSRVGPPGAGTPRSRLAPVAVLVLTAVLLLAGLAGPAVAQHAAGGSAVAAESGAGAGAEHGTPAAHGEHGEAEGTHLGAVLPLWSVIPFAGILLSIAIFPLVAPHFWHRRFPLLSAGWALAFAVPFLVAYRGQALHEILHIYIIDYIPFIILLFALFTAAGGVLLRGTLVGKPVVNVLLLLIGTLMASWIGTTGAAMILIRPLLRANAARRFKVHTVVFFIFLVANIGGSLTPLGDPPLFLGFLHGVPFFWTLHLFPEMATISGALLLIYFLLDTVYYRREHPSARAPSTEREALRLEGTHNFLFLGGVLLGVIISGTWRPGSVVIFGIHQEIQNLLRDGWLVLMGLGSWWTTRAATRRDNAFTWFPIQEVAYLFAGIFMTIIPALAILKAGEAGAMAPMLRAIHKPADYFWSTGILSSFLDNAPTYLTFFNSALGKFFPGLPEPVAVARLIGERVVYLQAISVSAVFMGANTYIGNAPNFMVKSIAEENGIAMPSFFGYMLRFSIPILIPLFFAVEFIFLR